MPWPIFSEWILRTHQMAGDVQQPRWIRWISAPWWNHQFAIEHGPVEIVDEYPWISMNSMEISQSCLCWPDFGVTLWNPPVCQLSMLVHTRSFARQCVPSLPSSLGPTAREMTGLMSTGPDQSWPYLCHIHILCSLCIYIYIHIIVIYIWYSIWFIFCLDNVLKSISW